ncbi:MULTISPECIES: globin [unclassified Rothia (in: high G+C Gram-positive bacteria)]|uniref:globin n=1 Tax=unclassified Rothia (in: high G+C Gram-positive bacteria) TaxID=2689056 RepID=UPI001956293E|nr:MULTISPECIES: globin [unclassified Rothia (in: high G+C Gram-positive bacteria)]MBM7050872.1 globin [Rothia sp. ZJ1223]QRZ62387.1 globin [Rothia sp. ZJ932]
MSENTNLAPALSQEQLRAQPTSFYEQVDGAPVFEKLVREFYRQVADDPEFRAMYPESDLDGAEWRLRTFLEQYWGGPKTYQEHRGHPRLRMRHMPFAIGAAERDTWLRFMRNAMDTLDLSPLHDAQMWDYFERAAHSMQNRA